MCCTLYIDQEFLSRRSQFYQALPLAHDVAAAVERFHSTLMRRRLVVGVHIRADQAVFDYAHIPSLSGIKANWSSTSPFELYEEVAYAAARGVVTIVPA